ncbi:transcription factor CP2 like gemini isoform X2 [Lycorma delicatula]|uniref:transcription factor CP2 like gemini isoform X2 n=1 Tax=Lycorma delicatula TaxID=130591 RepID=UPI003F511DC0
MKAFLNFTSFKNSVTCSQERMTANNGGDSGGWQPVEELANNLTDDLDGTCSLTSLGVDLNSSSYNINEALLALPLNFKQELPSPGNSQENGSLFGSSHMSPGSGSSGGVGNSSQNCSPRGHVNGSSSASNSPPHLLQMVKSSCYESTGEQKEKGPIPVCLVIPENHPPRLAGVNNSSNNSNNNNNSENNTNCNNSGNSAVDVRSSNNNNRLECTSHELNASSNNRSNNSNVINDTQNNKSLVVLSSATTTTATTPPPPISVVVQPSVVQQQQQSEHNSEDCRFQYVLAAATSIATKVNEETQTYLNQGQSYEIKLKKLGDLSHYRGKILKSVVRLSFHERRLQYMEGEQMAAWVVAHPSLKILEVDLPLSYGIVDVLQDRSLNTVEFLWDPTKEVGVYIKVNCISTEFTPNKHGGEKGVPFRIQVETYLYSQNGNHRKLHTASCQVKVFKLKGADRKHKQDREKILKRPPSEQEKYQPSYECTVLNDMPIINDTTYPASVSSSLQLSPSSDKIGGNIHTAQQQNPSLTTSVTGVVPTTGNVPAIEQPSSTVIQPSLSNNKIVQSSAASDYSISETSLSSTATVQQATAWLQTNRFASFIRTFSNFSGLDLLRLSCDNLIQICGLPEGIRLFNALHKVSRLTLYLCIEANPDVYHALYLAALTNQELRIKLASMLGISNAQIDELFLRGPNGIHIIVSDDVVRNFKDESTYIIELMQGHGVDCYSLLLKPSSKCSNASSP